MTDKPDVAALIAELREHAEGPKVCPDCGNIRNEDWQNECKQEGQCDWNRDHGTHSDNFVNPWKAKEDMLRAAAELTRLAAERVELDRLWTIKHDIAEKAEAERDKAKAEIARLTAENAAIIATDQRLIAENARLRALLEPFAESAAYFELFGIYGGVPVRHLREARAALKPDTREKP